MRRLVLALAVVLALSGCATYAWEKPGVPPDVAVQEEADCRALASGVAYEASVAAFSWGPAYRHWGYPGWGYPAWGHPAWGYPGWAHPGLRPWGPAWPSYGWYGPWGPDPGWVMATEQRVYDRCMTQKGYRLVEQPR